MCYLLLDFWLYIEMETESRYRDIDFNVIIDGAQ